MILRQVGIMTVIGGGIGLLMALWIGRSAEEILFQMKGRDPFVFAAATATLTLVALAAGLIPAHRASKVDPMTALRYE
jgi:putative ABC transport system permease protein